MVLTSIKAGDIVQIDKKGRIFLAFVEEKNKGVIKIKPLHNNISYFEATSREVKKHWKKMRNGTG